MRTTPGPHPSTISPSLSDYWLLRLCSGAFCLLTLALTNADDEEVYSPEELFSRSRDAVVTLTHQDREGNHNGMGTGFVISEDGLIATSLHVIGEARPIQVRFRSGESHEVEAIHAWDRKLDLAVLKINASNLTPLPLGDSDSLREGQAVVAIGNPMGLEQSIVSGIVSGIREFEYSDMIQLAIPIEPGNSGGPLLDRKGKVHGLLNLKSTVTANLGFATPINMLQRLLEKPNTVPLHQWLRIGALNPNHWEAVMGAHWNQRTGRIKVSGMGNGFGGRALCLRVDTDVEFPYEIEVHVRMNDESGAAGLVFGSDGGDRHYGFYPSNEQIRLTRFDGANVFTWQILEQIPSPHYRPRDWNHLRIYHDSDKIRGYLNGHLILESQDKGLPAGRIGLAKFRDTEAVYKQFIFRQLSPGDTDSRTSEDTFSQLKPLIYSADDFDTESLIENLQATPQEARHWLTDEASALEQRAARLRGLGTQIHRLDVANALRNELNRDEDEINLWKAALLIAKHDKPDLNIEDYLNVIEEMTRELKESLDTDLSPRQKLNRLVDYLFRQNGFHGSYFDYRNKANSYLDNVIDDREGLPITLSVLFMELGRRAGIDGLTGFPLPYHFLVKHSARGTDTLIDVFESGNFLTYSEADKIVHERQRGTFDSSQLNSASKQEIINRMLRNLASFAQSDEDLGESLPYLDLLIAINEDEASYRLERSWIRLRNRDQDGAKEDLQWILDHEPDGVSLNRVREALESL
jgi:serine protease Do